MIVSTKSPQFAFPVSPHHVPTVLHPLLSFLTSLTLFVQTLLAQLPGRLKKVKLPLGGLQS